MAQLFSTIETPEDLMDILQEGRRKGLFKTLSLEAVERLARRKEFQFPMQIPVELDNLMELMGNPIAKKVLGTKFDHVVGVCLRKAFETG